MSSSRPPKRPPPPPSLPSSSTSSSNKKPRFDPRNPSTLDPSGASAGGSSINADLDATDELILDADVIGNQHRRRGELGGPVKRNAVRIEGYDSDSEEENFDKRAEERARRKDREGGDSKDEGDGDEDDDMFADEGMGKAEDAEESAATAATRGKNRKKKDVRFLDHNEIEGQVMGSKSGGHVSGDLLLDSSSSTTTMAPGGRGRGGGEKQKRGTHEDSESDSSGDEQDRALLPDEEEMDADSAREVGAGGKKRHAPRLDAFNLREEEEEGRFDSAGNYVRLAADPDAQNDSWLEGLSRKDMRKAKEAQEARIETQRRAAAESDALLTSDLLDSLIQRLETGETPLEALQRLNRGHHPSGHEKKLPKWKQAREEKKKQRKGEANGEMDVDTTTTTKPPPLSSTETTRRQQIESITAAADALYSRAQHEIYHTEREMLLRQYRRETGEDWHLRRRQSEDPDTDQPEAQYYEYRWSDFRDDGVRHGPYDAATMKAWQAAGYFGQGIEFRRVRGSSEGGGEGEGEWTSVLDVS